MKAIVNQGMLAHGLSIVGRAVAGRSTLPILGNVMVSTGSEGLTLSATNLELMISCRVTAEVREEGATTIPARTLTDLVRALPDSPISLSVSENENTTLTCDGSRSRIKGIPAVEFPNIYPFPEDNSLTLLGIGGIIKQVAMAAATDTSRPVLEGVLVELSDNKLIMAAADGFRLAVCNVDTGVNGSISVIIPAKALSEVAKMDGEVELSLSENRAFFRSGGVLLVTQLIEGKFPDYNQIIPKDWTTRTELRTQDLLHAVRMASVFARDSSDIIKLAVDENSCVVSAQSAETGDHSGKIDVDSEGSDLLIGVNGKYLMDSLSVMGTDKVTIDMQGPSNPMVIRPVDGGDLTHVVMPVHISE